MGSSQVETGMKLALFSLSHTHYAETKAICSDAYNFTNSLKSFHFLQEDPRDGMSAGATDYGSNPSHDSRLTKEGRYRK